MNAHPEKKYEIRLDQLVFGNCEKFLYTHSQQSNCFGVCLLNNFQFDLFTSD